MDLTIAARMRNGTQIQGGMNTGRTVHQLLRRHRFAVGDGGFHSEQPHGILRVDPPFWRPEFKISGSTNLPYGVQVSAVYQQIPGIPITTSYVATNAEVANTLGRPLSGSASTVSITNVIPQSVFFEPKGLKQLDLRFIRNFRFGRTRLQALFDIYNSLNSAAILSETTAYGSTYRQANVDSGSADHQVRDPDELLK